MGSAQLREGGRGERCRGVGCVVPGGVAQRAGVHSPAPGPVSGWILTFPGAPMASLLSTRNPAAAPSPAAASTAAPTTPPLFSAHPPRLGSVRMRRPLQPARSPNKSPVHQVPSAHAVPRVCGLQGVGGGEGGGGVFSFPPDSPFHPCFRPQERALKPTQSSTLSSPHFCSSAHPLSPKHPPPRVVWNPLCPGSAA